MTASYPLRHPANDGLRSDPGAGVTYSTRDAARITGATADTLRWYERIGLVPEVPRGTSGRRRFTRANLRWVMTLRRLRSTGMPVAALQELTALHHRGSADAEHLIRRHRTQVLALLGLAHRSLATLDDVERELRRSRPR